MLDEAWERFVAFLRMRDARVTRERQIVLEVALSRTDHFLADDVATVLAVGTRRVSRGTVYRTLALLVEAGFLRQVRDSDTHCHYESTLNRDMHEHMVCERCGKFFEFSLPEVEVLLQAACGQAQFHMRSHRVLISGLCAACYEQDMKENKGREGAS